MLIFSGQILNLSAYYKDMEKSSFLGKISRKIMDQISFFFLFGLQTIREKKKKTIYIVPLRPENHKHFSKIRIHFQTFYHHVFERALEYEILSYHVTLSSNTVKMGALQYFAEMEYTIFFMEF